MWRALEAQGSHFEQATRLIEQAPGVSPPGQSPTLRQLRVALPAQRTSRAAKATPTVTSSIMCCLCRGGRIIARVEGQGRTANRTNASFVQFSGVPFSFQVRFGSLGVSNTRPYDTSAVHLSINIGTSMPDNSQAYSPCISLSAGVSTSIFCPSQLNCTLRVQ